MRYALPFFLLLLFAVILLTAFPSSRLACLKIEATTRGGVYRLGANPPWYRVKFTLGFGTRVASFDMKECLVFSDTAFKDLIKNREPNEIYDYDLPDWDESRGLHYTLDYPELLPDSQKNDTLLNH